MDQTLIIIKPEAMDEYLNIFCEIENNDFIIEKAIFKKFPREVIEEHYEEHKDKAFFDSLVDSLADKKIVVMILKKENAVKEWRELIGPTDPALRKPEHLRSIYGIDKSRNGLHGSDSDESAIREIKLFFKD